MHLIIYVYNNKFQRIQKSRYKISGQYEYKFYYTIHNVIVKLKKSNFDLTIQGMTNYT